jgi:hypothetical protein
MNAPFDDPNNPHRVPSGVLDEKVDSGREALPTSEFTLQLFAPLRS